MKINQCPRHLNPTAGTKKHGPVLIAKIITGSKKPPFGNYNLPAHRPHELFHKGGRTTISRRNLLISRLPLSALGPRNRSLRARRFPPPSATPTTTPATFARSRDENGREQSGKPLNRSHNYIFWSGTETGTEKTGGKTKSVLR